jgi:hypothetical protein
MKPYNCSIKGYDIKDKEASQGSSSKNYNKGNMKGYVYMKNL